MYLKMLIMNQTHYRFQYYVHAQDRCSLDGICACVANIILPINFSCYFFIYLYIPYQARESLFACLPHWYGWSNRRFGIGGCLHRRGLFNTTNIGSQGNASFCYCSFCLFLLIFFSDTRLHQKINPKGNNVSQIRFE